MSPNILMAFCISFSVILLQLVQTRIFSVIFWNHLVYFIISIALLGFGISGTWLSLRNPQLLRLLTIRRSCVMFVITAILSSLVVVHLNISIQNLSSHFFEIFKLTVVYSFATLPYFFAGWVLGSVFNNDAKNIHVLYFSDLIGAGLACIAYVATIQYAGASNLILFACALVLFPCIFFPGNKNQRSTMVALVALNVVAMFFGKTIDRTIVPEATKGYSDSFRNLQPGDQKIVDLSEWNPISRIDVLSTKNNPDEKRIFIDGDAWTNIVVHPPKDAPPFDPKNENMLADRFPYFLKKQVDSVLVIGAGGGIDIWQALRGGAKKVDAVEINPTTARISVKEYRNVNNELFVRPGVTIWNEEGRSFIRRSAEKYDVIMIHAIDTFAALSSGAYMLSENYLYTTDAFLDYFNHLKPNGLLCVTRWLYGGEPLRLFTTALEALYESKTPQPASKIMAVGTDWISLLVSNTSFTLQQLQAVDAYAPAKHAILYYPVFQISDLTEPYRLYPMYREKSMQEGFFKQVPYDVRPTTDDNPFFFHYDKWKNFLNVFSDKNAGSYIRGSWASFTLIILFIISSIALCIFIFLPLAFSKQPLSFPGHKIWVTYFVCLGISFIFTEIALMQRFSLLLGHPSRSIAVVLATLLLSSGVGSLISRRIEKHVTYALIFLSCGLVVAAYAYPSLIHNFLQYSLITRSIMTMAMITPLGLLMGIAFPTGIAAINEKNPASIAWMWGINGGTTVLGSMLAIIIAMNSNFTTVLLLAALGYIVAGYCYYLSQKI